MRRAGGAAGTHQEQDRYQEKGLVGSRLLGHESQVAARNV